MPRKRSTSKPRRTSMSVAKDGRSDRDPKKVGFLPDVLDRTVIAIPLLKQFKEPDAKTRLLHVAIDLNLDFRKGIEGARRVVLAEIEKLVRKGERRDVKQGVLSEPSNDMPYVFATLRADVIKELVRRDSAPERHRADRAIHHIWPDFELQPLSNKSISTVKGDALHNAFAALRSQIELD